MVARIEAFACQALPTSVALGRDAAPKFRIAALRAGRRCFAHQSAQGIQQLMKGVGLDARSGDRIDGSCCSTRQVGPMDWGAAWTLGPRGPKICGSKLQLDIVLVQDHSESGSSELRTS